MICHSAGRDLPAARQASGCLQVRPPHKSCWPPLPAVAGLRITAVEGSLYWPENQRLRAHGEDFIAGKCLFMRLKGEGWLWRAPNLSLHQHPDSCSGAASCFPSTEAPCPFPKALQSPSFPVIHAHFSLIQGCCSPPQAGQIPHVLGGPI